MIWLPCNALEDLHPYNYTCPLGKPLWDALDIHEPDLVDSLIKSVKVPRLAGRKDFWSSREIQKLIQHALVNHAISFPLLIRPSPTEFCPNYVWHFTWSWGAFFTGPEASQKLSKTFPQSPQSLIMSKQKPSNILGTRWNHTTVCRRVFF